VDISGSQACGTETAILIVYCMAWHGMASSCSQSEVVCPLFVPGGLQARVRTVSELPCF
jgi:hypothetical protein